VKERIIFVSNRLPVTIEKKRGEFIYRRSVGGLATGLGSFYESFDSMWIGWTGITRDTISGEERENIEETMKEKYGNIPIFLSKTDVKMFYFGFCNKTIWPLFHYFPNYTVYNEKFWKAYKKVNEIFCDVLVDVADQDDTIWIHDYQLMLLPGLIREKMPHSKIGFFLHIPFPSFEIFRLLPWRRELAEGLLGADLIGFHTYDYARHFLSSIRRLSGYEHTLGQINTADRVVQVDAFPMGIDYERYSGASEDPAVKKEMSKIRKKVSDSKIVLSVDRLDYTKGIIKRLEAFDHFLHENPKYHEKVTLILVAVPSRTGVETYMLLKKEIDELIGKINGEHGRIGWVPVWYLYRSLPFHTLAALYYIADVALVTPIRDGMNLIAKEYLATKRNKEGVLILSGMAGAVHELGEAIIVNPNNTEQVSTALAESLKMPVDEQIERNTLMQQRLQRYNVVRWAQDFFERLNAVREHQKKLNERMLTYNIRKKLIDDYRGAKNRLILFDYDGTLTAYSAKPEKALPDSEIIHLLRSLVNDSKNDVVIISERDKNTLEKWFGSIGVHLIGEHGVWVKKKNENWNEIEQLRYEWKEEIRPIFENYMDRTPGSFIEEKDYSLAWHYRMAEPDLAYVRVNELKETLLHLTENLNVGILEGKKVVEIKNSEVNKGHAVQYWLLEREWDFMIALGDDSADEELFVALPQSAYTIKVGLGLSQARYNIHSVNNVRKLLHELVQ
jgi:trehalose 6-phosphate synthase/phosphatase